MHRFPELLTAQLNHLSLVCQCWEGDLRVRQDQPAGGEQATGQENMPTS